MSTTTLFDGTAKYRIKLQLSWGLNWICQHCIKKDNSSFPSMTFSIPTFLSFHPLTSYQPQNKHNRENKFQLKPGWLWEQQPEPAPAPSEQPQELLCWQSSGRVLLLASVLAPSACGNTAQKRPKKYPVRFRHSERELQVVRLLERSRNLHPLRFSKSSAQPGLEQCNLTLKGDPFWKAPGRETSGTLSNGGILRYLIRYLAYLITQDILSVEYLRIVALRAVATNPHCIIRFPPESCGQSYSCRNWRRCCWFCSKLCSGKPVISMNQNLRRKSSLMDNVLNSFLQSLVLSMQCPTLLRLHCKKLLFKACDWCRHNLQPTQTAWCTLRNTTFHLPCVTKKQHFK